MKDVSQCLLSLIDEFEQYRSKIVNLEDSNQNYDENLKTLKSNEDELLKSNTEKMLALETKEKETELFLKEYEQLEARYKYYTIFAEKLRDENANMNADVLRLKSENEDQKDTIEHLKQKLAKFEKDEVKEPKNITYLFSKLETVKAELLASKEELSTLNAVQEENQQLKLSYEKLVQDKLENKSKQQKIYKQYLKIDREKNTAQEKMKHLEYEYVGLNKLYKNALHEKVLLKKKAEDLILEKYERMYETKHIFGIDMNTVRGQNNYTDIDSLIEGIDSKPPVPLKA